MATVGEIQNEADGVLISSINQLVNDLINRLLADLSVTVEGRKLIFDPIFFAQLEDRIINYMKYLGYEDIIRNYINKYGLIDDKNLQYYSRSLQLIEDEALNEQRNEIFRKQVADNLAIDGMLEAKDIANALRTQALMGTDIVEVQESLKKDFLQGDNSENTEFARRIDVTTHDAIMQYNGMQQESIANEFGLVNFRYISSVIETSRPICTHIHDNYDIVTKEDLSKILREYCPNGEPSQVKITYTTVNGVKHTKAKGSGMMKGTNEGNFAVLRGGYNCRHEVIYTRSQDTDKETQQILDLMYS